MSALFPDGDGIFETIKTLEAKPIALDLHLARAHKSAQFLGIEFPKRSVIVDEVTREINQNPSQGNIGRLRIIFTAQGNMSAIHETYRSWSQPARIIYHEQPIDERSRFAGIKALPYREQLECLEFAKNLGSDDVLRFNTQGQVCESAIANIALRIDGRWITPSLASGCLPGITRAIVIEYFGVGEAVIDKEELDACDSAFLLSSLKDAQPVAWLEGRGLEIDSDLAMKVREKMASLSVG